MSTLTETLSQSSLEAFRIRSSADAQLANVGITAFNLIKEEHPGLNQAAAALFKGDERKMGMWFVWPSADLGGKAPIDACRDGEVQKVTNALNVRLALAMM